MPRKQLMLRRLLPQNDAPADRRVSVKAGTSKEIYARPVAVAVAVGAATATATAMPRDHDD